MKHRIAITLLTLAAASQCLWAETGRYECTVSINGGADQQWVVTANTLAEAKSVIAENIRAEQPSATVSVSGCIKI